MIKKESIDFLKLHSICPKQTPKPVVSWSGIIHSSLQRFDFLSRLCQLLQSQLVKTWNMKLKRSFAL